jgi:moderate conductance mechanosensitive channel
MEKIMKMLEKINYENVIFTTLQIFLILIVTWVVLAIVKLALRRLEQRLLHRGQAEGEVPSESAKRVETLTRLLRQGIIIVVWVIAGLVVLREFGIDIGPILASAGVVGLAVGFGAQNLVRDVISGFFIILENQVRVGDVAVVNGTGGLVERINFRTIVLRDLSGSVHVFPNGTITTLSNMTRDWSAYVFDIGIAYKEDTDKVIEVIRELGQELKSDAHFGPLMVDDMEIFGLDNFADSAVVIKGRIKTKPIKQWEVGREFQRRLKKTFDAKGIEIPFPHRSIYFGEASKPFVAKMAEDAKQEKTRTD